MWSSDRRVRLWMAASAVLAFFTLQAAGAGAFGVQADFGGADDPSLHGTTGSLNITLNSGTLDDGDFTVRWSMDFTGYEGSASNHPYLTEIAFKAFKDISALQVVSIQWSPGDMTQTPSALYPANVNNSGCVSGSNAGMVCVTLDPMIDATTNGKVVATFSVSGELKLDEWSYRGKFGPGNGWVISESAAPVPEPGAALVFGAGLVTVGWRLRRSSRPAEAAAA